MRHKPGLLALILIACATDPDLTAGEQAEWDGGPEAEGEVIVIEGDWDACWDAGLCWGGVWSEDPADPGDTGGGWGGGGGTGGGDPGDQPERKKCSREQGLDACLDCCFYNYDKVDGWVCRRKKTAAKRERCWREAAKELADCQTEVCGRDRPIITTTTGELAS